MNSSPQPISPAADAEAALWAARLEGGTLDAANRNALDAWLAASPAHRAALSTYCQFSADLEIQLPALVAAGRVTLPAPAAPRRRATFAWFAASACAVAAVVALTVWLQPTRTAPQNLATAVAQRQAVTLADGTLVELNARTTLQVELGRSERRVRLASGEAYFQVSKDPARPFIVETPAGSVRVTGTKFNVLAESPTALDVTVTEGSVQVRASATSGTPVAAATPVALTAGDHLRARAGRDVVVEKLSDAGLANHLAWRRGYVVFDDVPLSEALARFAHYHGRGITATPRAGQLGVSARFNLDDLDGFFTSLSELIRVQTTRDPSGNYEVRLSSEKR